MKTSILALLACLLISGVAFAQENTAVFRNGLLTLPVVEDDGDTLTLELEMVEKIFPPQFLLTYSKQVFAPVNLDTPYFAGDYLVIPELAIGGESYWVELRLTGIDEFVLDNYGLNTGFAPGFPGGPGFSGGPAFNDWVRVPGDARDIGVGADGSVWVIGSDERQGGYGIYHWNGGGWVKVRGSARQVSVGPDGNPWVVNRDGEIYTRW